MRESTAKFPFWQWRIQNFLEEGAPTIKVGAPNYYFTQICPKTAWKWQNLDRGVHVPCAPPSDPLMLLPCRHFRYQTSSYRFTRFCLWTKFHRMVELNYWKHVKYLGWKESKRWHLYQLHDSRTLKYENSSNSARGDEFVLLRVQCRGAEVGGKPSHFERGWGGETLSLATIFLLLSGENGW